MNKKPTEPMKPAQISLRKKAQARQRLRARVWLALVALCALIWLAIIGLVLHLTAGAATISRHGQPAHLRHIEKKENKRPARDTQERAAPHPARFRHLAR